MLDFSALLPGPFATAILADLGADVIKVEPIHGESARAFLPDLFRTANRNKRSIALDLKQPAARTVIERLVAHADLALESFRPGVADRLGVGAAALRAINPRLVYCSLSGYGQDGPWRDHPGHDANFLAAAGGLAYAGTWSGAPSRSSLPVADLMGGGFAVSALLAALHQAQRSGEGCHLDLSLLESTFFCTAMRHGLDSERPRAHLFAISDLFETADGKRLALGLVEQHFFDNFRAVVRDIEPRIADPRFDTNSSRRENGNDLCALLHTLIRTRTADEWLALLTPCDVPVDVCVSAVEAQHNPQLGARGAVSELDGERFALFPVQVDGVRGGALRSPAPGLGDHGRELLAECRFSAAEITALEADGVVGRPR